MNIRQIVSAAFAIGVSMSGWAFDWTGRTGTVELPAGDVEVLDGDAATVSALTEIRMPDASTRLIFNTTVDMDVGMIHGEGGIVKKQNSVLTFREGDGQTQVSKIAADQYVTGGIEIEAGTLMLPQTSTVRHVYPSVTVATNATLVVQAAAATVILALNGDGTVTTQATDSRALQIGLVGDKTVGEFSGRILGDKITASVVGHQLLLGTSNTFAGDALTVYRNNDGDGGRPVYGTLETVQFGRKTDLATACGKGSVGLDIRFSGYLRYLGSGEETDRSISFRYLTSGQRGYANTLDAGPVGGVDFTGNWEFAAEKGLVSQAVLTGSNTVPCTVAVTVKDAETYPAVVTKRGPGTWRFKDCANHNFHGGMAVEEGTLQFDSIAESGTVCALGLATCLYKPYQGQTNDANRVDYAYLLGGTTTNVVFEYTGSEACSTKTRPVALKGKGACLRGSGAGNGKVSITGVSALADGDAVKTLVLDGASGENSVGDITDGTGRVGVRKTGSGEWTLFGTQSFTGPLKVEAGTLRVVRKRKYTWYRFTVRGTTNQVFFYGELGLFDKDGNQVSTGITMLNPPSLGDQSSAYCADPVDYQTLKPGQATVGSTKEIIYYKDTGSISGLFDGDTAGYWRSAWKSGSPSWVGNHIPVVFRLPEGANEAVAFDSLIHAKSQTISAFTLEGSVDGSIWTNLVSKQSYELPANGTTWASNGDSFTKGAAHTSAWTFDPFDEAEASGQLAGVESVAVSADATLKAEDGLTLSKLTLDCAAGALGTIEGVTFAEEGVLNLTGVGKTDQVVTTSFVNCTGVGNLAKWTVRIDGVESNRRFVEVGDGELKIRCRGLAVILR